jgi:hypothetical protein
MSGYDDDDIQFDFFDEPETVEATQRRRLPRLELPGGRGGGDDRPPRAPRGPGGGGGPTGLVPLARLVGLIAIAIAVIVGLVFWVGSCQGKSKQDEYRSYAEKVAGIAHADQNLGKEFASTLLSATKLSELETKLAEFAQQEQQEYTQAQEIRAPGPLRRMHTNLLDAIELRAKGLAGLGDVLAQPGATSSKNTTATENALIAQGNLLTAGDVVWEQLYRMPATQQLTEEGITGVVIPTSQFLQNADAVSGRGFSIVLQNLSAASTGGQPTTGLHGDNLVGVHVTPQGLDLSPSTASTIRVSADLSFVATVRNSGNFPETNVPVKLAIDSGSTHIKRTERITVIQPTETQSVTFRNFDLPPEAFANKVTITVTVGKVPGEKNLDNNTATYSVFFTLSS